MNYRVIITEMAEEDLLDIAYAVADLSKSIEPAKHLIQSLKEECKSLQDFPLAGAFPKDYILRSAGYRYLTCKGYLIVYEIDEDHKIVRVVAVFHEKLDYMRMLQRFM